MNIGLWAPLQQIAASMPEVLSSLNFLGVHVVWRATTQPAPVSSGMRRKGGVSQWLRMRNHRQLIDRVMRDKYCVVPPGVSRNDGSTNKQLLQQQKQQLCHFFRLRSLPLPSSSSREDTTTAIADDTPGGAAHDDAAAPARFIGQELYVDSLAHFVPWVYGYWNKGLWQFLRSLK